MLRTLFIINPWIYNFEAYDLWFRLFRKLKLVPDEPIWQNNTIFLNLLKDTEEIPSEI